MMTRDIHVLGIKTKSSSKDSDGLGHAERTPVHQNPHSALKVLESKFLTAIAIPFLSTSLSRKTLTSAPENHNKTG